MGRESLRIRSTERRDTATDAARNPAPVSNKPICLKERSHVDWGCAGVIDDDGNACGVGVAVMIEPVFGEVWRDGVVASWFC